MCRLLVFSLYQICAVCSEVIHLLCVNDVTYCLLSKCLIYVHFLVTFVALVEKQKETISGESSDRSQKKKLGKICSVILLSYRLVCI